MTFYEKYPQLQNKEFLTEVLVETVFSTMSLEDQMVSKPKVQQIIFSLLDEELKGSELAGNEKT